MARLRFKATKLNHYHAIPASGERQQTHFPSTRSYRLPFARELLLSCRTSNISRHMSPTLFVIDQAYEVSIVSDHLE